MQYRIPLLLLTLLIPFLLSSTSSSQTTSDVQKLPYRRTGKEATVIGSINVTGNIPKPKRIDMSADPACQVVNREPVTDFLITNEGGLVNAFIYVKNSEVLKAHSFEQPESEVVLRRRNCHYSPHVLALRVRQKLVIPNDDQTFHNTHPVPKLNPEWNQTQPPGTPPLEKVFTRPEQLIPFKCNQHPWEKAYVAVMDHPFFAISDEFGNYEIRGLPPGTYTLVAWHELLGEQQVELTVGDGEHRRTDFTFAADK